MAGVKNCITDTPLTLGINRCIGAAWKRSHSQSGLEET